MGTKLTNWMREAIVKAVVAHRFADAALEIVQKRAALAAKVYDDLYSEADRKKMAALPNGWLPEDYDIGVQFGAGRGYENLPFNGSLYGKVSSVLPDPIDRVTRRMAYHHTRGCARVYEPDEAIVAEYNSIAAAAQSLSDEIETAQRQATAAVSSVSTIKRLIEVWPGIEPFAAKYEDEAKPNLPALPTAQLNALFKLPVSEAA